MQRRTEDRDFSAYNAAQQGRPVRPLAVRAVDAGTATPSAGPSTGTRSLSSPAADRGREAARTLAAWNHR